MRCLQRRFIPSADGTGSRTVVSLYGCHGALGDWYNVETRTATASCAVRFVLSESEAQRIFETQTRECARIANANRDGARSAAVA